MAVFRVSQTFGISARCTTPTHKVGEGLFVRAGRPRSWTLFSHKVGG